MKSWKKFSMLPVLAIVWVVSAAPGGCTDDSSDKTASVQQEQILKQASSSVGMPAITNFTEKRLLKMVMELRDQANLTTYTYVWPEMSQKPVFFCKSIGYGLPYATQFTNPQKLESPGAAHEYTAIAQADPNGLFSPSAAEGTWIMCKDPSSPDVKPVYVEPRVVVSPFPLQ